MALKSILDVQLNDAAFLRFKKLFDQYEASLKSMPAAWAAVNKKIDGTRSSFDKMVESAVALNVQSKLQDKAQERADRLTRSTADRWASMARSTREFSGNIAAATISLLRWASLTGVVSGLVGAGGLYGIDRLAVGVSGSRRSALGLGLGYGEQRAFATNFGRLVDPDAFLSGVAGAKLDVTRRVGLLGAGLTQGEIGGDTATTAVALLRNLKRIADNTNPALYGQVIAARQLGQFVSPEDLQRLRNTSSGEFSGLLAQYATNRGQFDLPPDVARKWQEFTTQLTRAGQGIENTFVRGLAPLTPALTQLSSSVEKVIGAALQSPALARWIKLTDEALEKFANYVGTDDFRKKVETFVSGLGALAGAVAKVASFFGSKDALAGAGIGAVAGGAVAGLPGAAAGAALGGLAGQAIDGTTLNVAPGGYWSNLWRNANRWWEGGGGLLGIVRRLEGSGDAAVSPKGAVGRYQIEPGTARQYGFDPSRLSNPAYNETVARAVLSDLVRRYHGNTAEVLAAYNAGPGRADRFRSSGDDLRTLPLETQRYITNARGMDGYAPTVVTIDNNTGGNVNVSVNGLKN